MPASRGAGRRAGGASGRGPSANSTHASQDIASWVRCLGRGAQAGPGPGTAAPQGRGQVLLQRSAALRPQGWPGGKLPAKPGPCGPPDKPRGALLPAAAPTPSPGLSPLSPSPFVPTPRMVATLRGLSPGWGAWGGKGWWPRSPSREVCCFLATRELVPLAHRHHHGQHRQAPLGPSVPSLGGRMLATAPLPEQGCWARHSTSWWP